MDRMISRIFFVLVAILLLNLGVEAQKRKTLETQNTVIYALPQTVIKVEVLAEKTVLKRGPFAEYAQKYLGVTDIVKSNGVDWKLKAVQVSSVGEVDPEQYHKIVTSVDYEPSLISLTPEGLIAGFNTTNREVVRDETEFVDIDNVEKQIEYGAFAINPMLNYSNDTVYKVVETDTAFIKVPVLEKQVQVKSIEEKAEEAAHQIFKLRKRRFKILTANYEVLPPDGKAYEVIVRELEKLENDYLSLFVGKKSSQFVTRTFSYAPKKGEEGGVVFRMSPQMGPVGVKDLGGKPVRIMFTDLQITRELVVLPTTELTEQKLISYRIPGMADVSITNGKNVLYKKRLLVAQFGKIAKIPAEILLNENYSIEFYPEFGSIKNIRK